KFLRKARVNKVVMDIKRVINPDPVKFLLNLSELCSSIAIIQERLFGFPRTSSFLFGVSDGDWSTVIPAMFDRKLESLSIHNYASSAYLSESDQLALIRGLTRITSRQIRFVCT
ncbi:hypothetical protein PFISCL1PPCAC_17431, partial [Pristionchus fissidentatus]